VRERIQINNQPLSEEAFAKYFFEVWDRLEESAAKAGHKDPKSTETKPVYFRFLTLMALHSYMQEKVGSAVLECGIGGEYDSTNILIKPSATAVTSLGIDHTAMLGDTIESIAWHKAGVFKEGVPAFTAPQPESALKVLHERAQERKTTLLEVPRYTALDHIWRNWASLACPIPATKTSHSQPSSSPVWNRCISVEDAKPDLTRADIT
jgi:folylpolyglutamate synthase